MDSINKNTEIVGVSDALKALATSKLSPINVLNAVNPMLQKQHNIEDPIDGVVAINPSSHVDESTMSAGQLADYENGNIMNEKQATSCGWSFFGWNFRPKILQFFMTPKWALTFLCIAGTTQGKLIHYLNVILPKKKLL